MVPSSAFEPCSGPLRAPSTCRPKIAKGGMLPALRGRRGTRDRGPKLESPGPCGSVVDGGKVLAAERKEVVDLIMGREEPLRLTGGFEPLHLPFAPPGRLVGILGSVVEALVCAGGARPRASALSSPPDSSPACW